MTDPQPLPAASISWGSWEGTAPFEWQAGLDVSMSPGTIGPSTTSVTLTWTGYVRRSSNAAASSGSSALDSEYLGGWTFPSSLDYWMAVGSFSETVATTYATQNRSKTLNLVESTYSTTPSVSKSITIPARPPALPSAPTAATATYVSDAQVTVAWTRPADADVDDSRWASVRIRRWAKSTGAWTEVTSGALAGTATTWSDTSTQPNDEYRWEVYGLNATGPSPTGAETGTITTTPGTPSSLTAIFNSAGDVVIWWRDNSRAETHFEVEGGGSVVGTATAAPFVHDTASSLTYRVRAVAAGPRYSAWSAYSLEPVEVPDPLPTIDYDPDDPIFRGHRIEHHWVELLDENDNPVRVLSGTSDGTVTQNIDAPIRGGFQFTLKGNDDIRWMRARFRPWVMVNGKPWPLGVYLASSPDLNRDGTAMSTYTVAAHDKLIILEQDKVTETYSVPEGAEVVGHVVSLIASTGETAMAVTQTPATTRTAMTWQVATPKRKIINDLLTHINFSSIWVDYYGQYRIQPHQEPREKPTRATFREGETSIHSPEWSRSQDIANVPNQVILVAAGSDEQEEMVAYAQNNDPASPYSWQERGERYVSRSYDVNASDQATLDALAQRYLANATRAVAHLTLQHAVVPLDPGDVVRFVSGPVDTRAQVKEFSIPLQTGAPVSATWTEVTP